MNLLSGILGVVGGIFTTVGTWMTGYGKEQNMAARTANDDQKKLDDFKKAEANGDIEKVRSSLGVPPPPFS